MSIFRRLRTAIVALTAVLAMGIGGTAFADSGTIQLSWIKGGWFVGGSAGNGTLFFKGRSYPLAVGGVSGGLVFGAARSDFSGTVRNIRRPSDVAGVYGAAGAGVAAGPGAGAIVLTNGKGAVLELRGRQAGLMLNADLSGLVIDLK